MNKDFLCAIKAEAEEWEIESFENPKNGSFGEKIMVIYPNHYGVSVTIDGLSKDIRILEIYSDNCTIESFDYLDDEPVVIRENKWFDAIIYVNEIRSKKSVSQFTLNYFINKHKDSWNIAWANIDYFYVEIKNILSDRIIILYSIDDIDDELLSVYGDCLVTDYLYTNKAAMIRIDDSNVKRDKEDICIDKIFKAYEECDRSKGDCSFYKGLRSKLRVIFADLKNEYRNDVVNELINTLQEESNVERN